MASSPTKTGRYTIKDLEQFPDDGKLRELVDGEIVEWDVPTYRHAFLVIALGAFLRHFVNANRLGQVVGGNGMVRIQGSEQHARGADVAFYRRDRVPRDIDAAATAVVPDMVVEIVSPSDRANMVDAKIGDWLDAGVQLLWYVNPETGTTTVFHQGRITRVAADDLLDGGDVLPGLQLRLRDLLDELDEEPN